MRKAVGEARIEDDRQPVERKGHAVFHFVSGRRLHPAIGRQNPERRRRGADRDDDRRHHVEPARHQLGAEQQHAEERRLQEKRGQHFVTEQRTEHIAGRDREPAPVGADLVGQHDAGHHAHCERDREDLGPEPHQQLKAFIAGAQPHRAERGDVGRQADGEARKNDVEDDGEGELQPGQHDRIEFHRLTPERTARPAILGPPTNSLRADPVPRLR